MPAAGADASTRFGQQALQQRRAAASAAKTGRKGAVIMFPGDAVLPQFADGAGWKTTLYIHNLETAPRRANVYFLANNGDDMLVDLAGRGRVSHLTITLKPSASVSLSSLGTGQQLTEGWAVVLPEGVTDAVVSMGVFRYQPPKGPAYEAVVPVNSMFDEHSTLLYDNRNGYVSAMSIVNPTPDQASAVTVTIRDEAGEVLRREVLQYESLVKEAFLIPERWPETKDKAGSIEFVLGVDQFATVLGLRGTPEGTLSSVHTVSSFKWQ